MALKNAQPIAWLPFQAKICLNSTLSGISFFAEHFSPFHTSSKTNAWSMPKPSLKAMIILKDTIKGNVILLIFSGRDRIDKVKIDLKQWVLKGVIGPINVWQSK